MADVDTVTIPRVEYDALLQALEDAEDRATIAERRHQPTLSLKRVERSLEGENLIKLWREERGLKQKELAEAGNIARSTMSEIESGKKQPGITVLRRFAAKLGVPVDALLDDEE